MTTISGPPTRRREWAPFSDRRTTPSADRLGIPLAEARPLVLRAAGRYTVEGDRVTVSAFVVREEQTVGSFGVNGSAEDVARLAVRIARRAQEVIG